MKMINVTVDDGGITIHIDRQMLFEWVTGEAKRVADINTSQERVENSGSDKPESEPQTEVATGYETSALDAVDLFEPKGGIGGTLQDAPDGRKKIDEIRAWLKKQKFSYKNFCLYLSSLTEVGGWPMAKPVIGNKQDGEPSVFYLAFRYYSYWKSQQETIAKEYKQFLFNQVREMGYTIEKAAEILEGEIIDPAELPKGTEVSA
jgi:hypothetical protein